MKRPETTRNHNQKVSASTDNIRGINVNPISHSLHLSLKIVSYIIIFTCLIMFNSMKYILIGLSSL